MQLSRIYSNAPSIFNPIDFNYGRSADRLNVVYGEVRHPKDRRKDSHNLGKTTLVHLIDFLMLKGTSPDQFLVKNRERFHNFVFYLEIALNAGDFATIRRSVSDPNKISMSRHLESRDFTSASAGDWGHPELSREDATKLLDGWLDLRILKPYEYRQAITYFLRTQADYGDELQLQKFSSGKDKHWKPFVAHLFGFKEEAIDRKYELDERIETLRAKQATQQATIQFSEEQLPELIARIGVVMQQVDETEAQLDAFQFEPQERKMVSELVDSIEVEISSTNDRIYAIRYDIKQIDSALSHKDKFDLAQIDEIFSEAQVHLPNALKKNYADLVEFNKKITHERNTALRARRKELVSEELSLQERKLALDSKREERLSILRSTDTIGKFKQLQKIVARHRAQLVYLEEQRRQLELLAETAHQIREAQRERGRVIDEIKTLVARSTPVVTRFSALFNSYCQTVLNHEGMFYFKVNNSDNFDYSISLQLAGQDTASSSLSDGTSYKKLLCVLFDLALLRIYEDAPFFHFVYHDGIFEALDDRKKLALLDILRGLVKSGKIQYILTLIDSDMPRDERGNKIAFGDDEVVVRLHDSGNQGRLFKMAEF